MIPFQTSPSAAQWLGIDHSDIDFTAVERPLHRALLEPLAELRAAAAQAGFDLAVASGYRDFERQAVIWNAKARGERPVHDDGGRAVAIATLDDVSRVKAIWRYSALPGTSRHHWGTDIDVYDRAAVPADYRLQLSPAEYAPGGPFAALSRWLGERIGSRSAAGFFRPYAVDRGGIAPEPWHLSYAPVAWHYQRAMAPQPLVQQLEVAGVALRQVILADLEGYWRRYVQPPMTGRPPLG